MDNGASSYRRFLEGDETAFDEILKEYRDHLVFFINRYVQDYGAAEDIAIDVFVQLIIHRYRYNFKTPFKTYLFMMGHSRALDYLRRRKRITLTDWSDMEAELSEFTALEENLLADERRMAVHNGLAKLPEDMRAAVHLVYFEQLSYEDAAKVMKKNRKQVDNLLYRAKAELRKIIGEEGRLLI